MIVFTAALTSIGALAQNVSPTINDFASKQFGQSPNVSPFNQPINTNAPNLVEGRELYSPASIAFDKNANPPILYVADTFNNRVLAFKNPSNLAACGLSAPSSCGVANMSIGQRDLYSTQQSGPGRPGLNAGFLLPTSVAVDASGNLYVLDAGNNRILRFPSPFKQTVSPLVTDLVIGQKTVASGVQPNQGNGSNADATTLNFANTFAAFGLVIDPGGNLFVSDYGNNRVLRFPVGVLTPGNTLPAADIAIGQSSLTSNTVASTCNSALVKGCLYLPTAMTVDSQGNLYIADNFGRIQYFTGPFQASGQSSSRILGVCEAVPPVTAADCNATGGNKYGVGTAGLFSDGSHLFVADGAHNRIAEYDVPSNWPAGPNPGDAPGTKQDSPPIMAVFGQADFSGSKANKGQPEPDATTFSVPRGGAFNGTEMWVADTSNHRVLGFSTLGSPANHLVGQLDYPFFQPNLIEGRELFLSNGSAGADVAIDHTSNPPHLYIADTLNHRILGFKDARSVKPGQKADLVIGQTDLGGQPGSRFYRGLINNPKNDGQLPQQGGLNRPSGVLVDPKDGSLWVADSGNSRVLRFPSPFAPENLALPAELPNLVLGQLDFTSSSTDAAPNFMAYPFGLVLLSNGSLAVSDVILNRITIFKRPAGGDFQSGAAANAVLGQQTFNTSLPSSSPSGLSLPLHMGVDSSDRLYVADSGNNRMVVFANTSVNGTSSVYQLTGLNGPQGVVVSQVTGESFLLQSSVIWRLPEFNTLVTISNPNVPVYTQQISLQSFPLGITFDNSNNLIVGETANRVTFYYAKLTYQHAANYNGGDGVGNFRQGLAPGQLALIYRVGQNLSLQNATAATLPWQTTMSDYQVTVNGTPAPIFAISAVANYIAIQVPSNAPQGGTADFVLSHPSTGEIVGAASVPMAQYNPGFFTSNAQGFGQIAAFNQDNSVNSATNPISRDGKHYISLCLTGGGVFNGGPKDGEAPTAATAGSTADKPVIFSDAFPPGGIVPDSFFLYSGAGCGFPGLWQLIFTVPSQMSPGIRPIAITIGGYSTATRPSAQSTTIFTN
jgi:uncharacterized protein (TIGR03437 family)